MPFEAHYHNFCRSYNPLNFAYVSRNVEERLIYIVTCYYLKVRFV